MNIILIQPDEISDGEVFLSDRRARHIHKVLKSRVGDSLRIGIIGGQQGRGFIREINPQGVIIQIDCPLPSPAKTAPDLILAIPRPIMLKRVLAQAAAMGVARIMLINARRVEKSFFHSSQLEPQRIIEALLQGLEQAGDTLLPQVTIHPRFRPFIEDEFSPMASNYPIRLLAHPDVIEEPHHTFGRSARLMYTEYTAPGCAPTQEPAPTQVSVRKVLAIGPEGGWVDFEVQAFKHQGFSPFSLGPRILRVDCAVPALLALNSW